MAAKKQLELTPTPLEGDEAEAKFDPNRRLELTTKSGNVHSEFSHESGTVKIDDTGIDEYRERSEQERSERSAKLRAHLEKEVEKLRTLTEADPAQEKWNATIDDVSRWGRSLLIGLTVYFGLRGVYELVCLSMGRPATEFWPFAVLAVMAALALSIGRVPARLLRIGARFAYSFALIFFGIRGVLSLIQLSRNPPAVGINWGAGGWSLFGAALSVIGLVLLFRLALRLWRHRSSLIAMLDGDAEPKLPFGIAYTNRNQLRYCLYSLEGSFLVMGLLALTVVVLRVDPLSLFLAFFAVPPLLILYLFPFVIYVSFRAAFFPHV